MRNREVYMTPATQQMVADTLMRVLQLHAAIRAISILDWEYIKQIRPLPEESHPYPEWHALFVGKSARHGAWFEEYFGEFPETLRQGALRGIAGELCFPMATRDPTRWMGKTLREYLMGFRSNTGMCFSLDPTCLEMVEEISSGRLRLRLYDRSTQQWAWRMAAYEWGRHVDRRGDDGEEMSAVPATRATLSFFAALAPMITMYNNEELLVDPVIAILPFNSLDMPISYFQRHNQA